jgi:hypothetical protein
MCYGALAGSAYAQEPAERDDVHLRNDCRLAAQVLATGQPAPHYPWALGFISRCDDSGPAALAALWTGLSETDGPALESIAFHTSRLRDQRILEVVLRVARDGGRPARTRLAALQVLASYFDTAYVTLETLEAPPPVAVLTRLIDFVPSDGSQPLAAGAPQTIRAELETLGQADPDPVIQRAAQFVARALNTRRLVRERSP